MLRFMSESAGWLAFIGVVLGGLGILICWLSNSLYYNWFLVTSVAVLAGGIAFWVLGNALWKIDRKIDAKKFKQQEDEKNEKKYQQEEEKKQQFIALKNEIIDTIEMHGCTAENLLIGLNMALGIDYTQKKILVIPREGNSVNAKQSKMCDFYKIIDVEYVQNSEVKGGGGDINEHGGYVKSVYTVTEHAVRIIVDDRDNPSMVAHFEGCNEAEYAYGILRGIFIKK